MNVLILTGGDVDIPFAAGFLREEPRPLVIAVDGGLRYAKALGIVPDCLVGDFDTAGEEAVKPYEAMGVPVMRHRPEKDCTDTELALLYALDLPDVSHITILGAFGGRFDHALANVQILLHALKKKVPCFLADPQNLVFLADGPVTFSRNTMWKPYISLIPLTERARGVTLTGFRYPLSEAELSIGKSLGVSNELIREEGFLDIKEGVLICIQSRDQRD